MITFKIFFACLTDGHNFYERLKICSRSNLSLRIGPIVSSPPRHENVDYTALICLVAEAPPTCVNNATLLRMQGFSEKCSLLINHKWKMPRTACEMWDNATAAASEASETQPRRKCSTGVVAISSRHTIDVYSFFGSELYVGLLPAVQAAYTVSQKIHHLWNDIVQNYKHQFWRHLAEIVKRRLYRIGFACFDVGFLFINFSSYALCIGLMVGLLFPAMRRTAMCRRCISLGDSKIAITGALPTATWNSINLEETVSACVEIENGLCCLKCEMSGKAANL